MSKVKNIKEIVAAWLTEQGYDGLVNLECGDECGCGIDDLLPCGNGCFNINDCRAAYKHKDELFYLEKEGPREIEAEKEETQQHVFKVGGVTILPYDILKCKPQQEEK